MRESETSTPEPFVLTDVEGNYLNPAHFYMWPDPSAPKPRIPVYEPGDSLTNGETETDEQPKYSA